MSAENNVPENIFTETEAVVEFYDVDSMQIVWYGNYIKFFDIGRRALFEKIGYNFEKIKTDYIFPIVDIKVKYINSLRFLDRIRIKSFLTEYENGLKMKYEIWNTQTGELAAKGSTTQMVLDIKTGVPCFNCPAGLIDKIKSIEVSPKFG